MIKLKTNDGHVKGRINGNVDELFADVIIIIHTVYESIKEDSPEGASFFKERIINACQEDLPFDDFP